MKRLLLFSLFAALAALSTTGCNPFGPSKIQRRVMVSIEERTGSEVRLRELNWNEETAVQIDEVLKVNGTRVHRIYDYSYNENVYPPVYVRNRDNYAEDGVTVTSHERLTSKYGWSDGYNWLETEYSEVIESGPNAGLAPSVIVSATYDDNGRITEFSRIENGIRVMHRINFEYDNSGSYTYDESLNSGAYVKMFLKWTNPDRTECELYSGWDNTSARGTLIEKKDNYSATTTTVTYDVTRYDSTVPVVTMVTERYKMLEIVAK